MRQNDIEMDRNDSGMRQNDTDMNRFHSGSFRVIPPRSVPVFINAMLPGTFKYNPVVRPRSFTPLRNSGVHNVIQCFVKSMYVATVLLRWLPFL